MNRNKPIALVVGALVAVFVASLVVRFVVLSQAGLSGGSFFYLGLPVAGIGALTLLLLRLGLLGVGQRSSATIQHWEQHSAGQGPAPASPLVAASTPQRLEDLEFLRASGTISEVEYTAERARIIPEP
jgi:hypothetical protein